MREPVMRLLSVNVGAERKIRNAKSSGRTGIYKVPVEGAARVTRDGVAGDVISDEKNHGGMNQALYLYGAPDCEWWSKELGCDLAPGTFGENLTLYGLESALARRGDRLRVGSTILEVTAPRIPCVTLVARMEDPAFVRCFREAERPGLYCRVVREGELQAEAPVGYKPCKGPPVSAIEVFRDAFEPDLSETRLRRFLAAPIDVRSRAEKKDQLGKLLSGEAGEPRA